MKSMELTDREVAQVLALRREREEEQRREEKAKCREQERVLRDERGVRVERVNSGKHTPYAVYIDGELLCYCTYRKGAFALADYIIKNIKQKKEAA